MISILLLIVTARIDKGNPLFPYVPDLFRVKIPLASSISSTLAGSFFTFSTMMLVVTTYASNYTPRVVENFLANRITMGVIGLFVGGFLYTVVSLFLLKDSVNSKDVVSATVAIVYSLASIGYFIKFVFFVSNQIQDVNLIKQLDQRAGDVIDRFVEEHRKHVRVEKNRLFQLQKERPLYFDRDGCLELLDYESLLSLKSPSLIHVHILPKIGDFLTRNQMVAKIYYDENAPDEKIAAKTIAMPNVEQKKFTRNDYLFSIQKLVEIALRTISPGINDPNTAINCIYIINTLLGKLSEIYGNYTIVTSKDKNIKITFEDFNLESDLYHIFYQIIHYGKEDLSVVIAIFEALKTVLRVSHASNRRTS